MESESKIIRDFLLNSLCRYTKKGISLWSFKVSKKFTNLDAAQFWKAKEKWSFGYFYENFAGKKFKIGEDDDGVKLRIPL